MPIPVTSRWDEFERNQLTLQCNAVSFATNLRGTAPREGIALLQGRVLCGRCGSRMRVRYDTREGRPQPYYCCNEGTVRRAESRNCQWVQGTAIDCRDQRLAAADGGAGGHRCSPGRAARDRGARREGRPQCEWHSCSAAATRPNSPGVAT